MDEAIDRVIAGPQKRTRLMNERDKLITAYHEGGHALVAAALPGTDPVHKVTILPRGRALGYTMVLPEQDKYSNSRAELLDQLAYMMGGRAAEELVFHDPTTGASNDIEKATNVARAMVTQYGMTERIGAVKLGSDGSEPFLGRDFGHQRDYSEDIAAIVDEEVSKLIGNAHQEAFDILNENRDVLDALVRALFEKETLDRQEVAAVFQPLVLRPRRPAWTGSDNRVPSAIPPVTPPPPALTGRNGHSNGYQPNGQSSGGQGLPPGPNPPGGVAVPPGHIPGATNPPGQPEGGSKPWGPQPPTGPSGPVQGPGGQDPQPGPGQNWPPAGPDYR
jgi:cell division protease FtsH